MTDERAISRDEGVIKFDCRWQPGPAPEAAELQQLIEFRKRLFDMNLIGVYPDGIGFGNVSVAASPTASHTAGRAPCRRFFISASQTGHLAEVQAAHFVEVDNYNIDENWVACTGPMKPSSESLTHAMIYATFEDANAVIHVHSHDAWQQLIGKIATSRPEVAYGTPAMAREVERLAREEQLADRRIFVMSGHDDGIVSFGKNCADAFAVLSGTLAAYSCAGEV